MCVPVAGRYWLNSKIIQSFRSERSNREMYLAVLLANFDVFREGNFNKTPIKDPDRPYLWASLSVLFRYSREKTASDAGFRCFVAGDLRLHARWSPPSNYRITYLDCGAKYLVTYLSKLLTPCRHAPAWARGGRLELMT